MHEDAFRNYLQITLMCTFVIIYVNYSDVNYSLELSRSNFWTRPYAFYTLSLFYLRVNVSSLLRPSVVGDAYCSHKKSVHTIFIPNISLIFEHSLWKFFLCFGIFGTSGIRIEFFMNDVSTEGISRWTTKANFAAK